MATDPKKDQEDQPERRIATAGKSAELTEEQLRNLAAGGKPQPNISDDQLKKLMDN